MDNIRWAKRYGDNKALGRLFQIAAPGLLLVMTFGIYYPSMLFLGNADEFALTYGDIVPYILLVSLMMIFAIGVIAVVCFKNAVFKTYYSVIFSLGIGFYLQGNFFNFGLSELNGSKINWSEHWIGIIISTVVWIICFTVPIIFILKKEKLMAKVITFLSLLLFAMQLVSLIVGIVTTKSNLENNFAITKKGEFQLSSNENVIMFVVDTLDAKWFEDMIVSNDQYKHIVKDFTYYNNAVAGGAPTELGIPTILSGEAYNDTEMTIDEYYKDAYENSSVFKDLKDNGYLVKLYTDYKLLNHSDIESVDNAITGCKYKVEWKSEFVKYLYKFASFYSMPMPLKQYFWFYSDSLFSLISVSDESIDQYKYDDPQFYQDFVNNGITTQSDNNAFIMYHLTGAHAPYWMDENANRTEEETTLEQQVYGSFKIINDYLDELKNKGLYDKSTIIITADHGGEDLYQNPAVMVKQCNQSYDEIVIDNSPVTFKNLTASFIAATMKNYNTSDKGYKRYGNTLEKVSELYKLTDENNSINSVRYHAAPKILGEKVFSDNSIVKNKELTLYKITGNARDINNIEPVDSGKYDLTNK